MHLLASFCPSVRPPTALSSLMNSVAKGMIAGNRYLIQYGCMYHRWWTKTAYHSTFLWQKAFPSKNVLPLLCLLCSCSSRAAYHMGMLGTILHKDNPGGTHFLSPPVGCHIHNIFNIWWKEGNLFLSSRAEMFLYYTGNPSEESSHYYNPTLVQCNSPLQRVVDNTLCKQCSLIQIIPPNPDYTSLITANVPLRKNIHKSLLSYNNGN